MKQLLIDSYTFRTRIQLRPLDIDNINNHYDRYIQRLQGNGLRKEVIIKGVKIGRGIQPTPDYKYKTFGKFLIHYPSLKQNILNIKFQSRGSHPKFPRIKITDTLKNMIQELLDTEQLNNTLYNEINEEEKKVFDKLSYYSNIQEKIGSSIYQKDKEEMEDFNILKYQILSGNNNRKLLNQMKKYILKFIKENKIEEQEGKDILSCIGEVIEIEV